MLTSRAFFFSVVNFETNSMLRTVFVMNEGQNLLLCMYWQQNTVIIFHFGIAGRRVFQRENGMLFIQIINPNMNDEDSFSKIQPNKKVCTNKEETLHLLVG